jgi:peptidoglycan/xylan/chitin deacetylase (PgdA/CDA1 family)
MNQKHGDWYVVIFIVEKKKSPLEVKNIKYYSRQHLTKKKKNSLQTYDDGPNCSHNALYDMLQRNNQRASMFYIGSNVLYWPYGALRGLKDGHHLCGHTWSHAKMTTLTNQEVLAELYYTAKAIKYVTGVTPLYWRPVSNMHVEP